jgi:hypothetical protein
MKMTIEEQNQLRILIWDSVHHQETYNEVYDHILAAVEELPEVDGPRYPWFESMIAREFGTLDILRDLEIERVKVIAATMKKKLLQYMIAWFAFPLGIFTLCIAGLSYLMINQVPRTITFWLTVTVALVPMAIEFSRIPDFFKRSKKPSVKLGGIATANHWVAMISGCMIYQWFANEDHLLFNTSPAWVITAVFMLYVIYALSFIKVYREAFKLEFAL